MSYVTSWERRGERKGIRKGRLEDKREVLIRLLSRKFQLDECDHERIHHCNKVTLLDAALDTVIDAEAKEEVLRHIL